MIILEKKKDEPSFGSFAERLAFIGAFCVFLKTFLPQARRLRAMMMVMVMLMSMIMPVFPLPIPCRPLLSVPVPIAFS